MNETFLLIALRSHSNGKWVTEELDSCCGIYERTGSIIWGESSFFSKLIEDTRGCSLLSDNFNRSINEISWKFVGNESIEFPGTTKGFLQFGHSNSLFNPAWTISSKQVLQKECKHGNVLGSQRTSKQIEQESSSETSSNILVINQVSEKKIKNEMKWEILNWKIILRIKHVFLYKNKI